MPEVCSDKYPNDEKKNVPRDLVSYKGDKYSATSCTYKCFFFYNYAGTSSSNITNETDRLSVRYDGGGDVSFNTETFTPMWVRIFKPSLHSYNGTQAAAELIIEHSAKASSSGLLVCIPLASTGGSVSDAANLVEQIILKAPTVKNQAESGGIQNFSLNRLIPTAPYYTYRGPLPYDDCLPDSIYQYVVFHPNNKGALSISTAKMNMLDKLVSYSFIKASKGTDVFFNAKGTTSNGFNGEDQIYIKCQPTDTGNQEEKVYKEPISPFSSLGDSSDTMTFIIYMVVGVGIILLVFKLFEFGIGFLSHPPREIKIYTGGKR